MNNLFTLVLDGMEDNNSINDASFGDWDDAGHAIEVYGDAFDGECSDDEMQVTIKALNMIIESDGEKYNEAVDMWNEAVWGQSFADNNRSVAFGS